MSGPSSARPTMRVRLIRGGKVVRSFVVKKDTFTIGSGQEAAVRIGGIPDLAPKHALIWLDEGIPTLVPSSGCTVLVNGAAVKHAQLGPADTVSLGKLDLQIESLVEPASAPAQASPAAPPPQAAPPPRVQPPAAAPKAPPPRLTPEGKLPVNPSVFDDFGGDDEKTQVSAPSIETLRNEARLASGPSSPLGEPALPSSKDVGYFGDDERTIPSGGALGSRPPAGLSLSDEEQTALADLLPFASPVAGAMDVQGAPSGPTPMDSAPPLSELARSPAPLSGDVAPETSPPPELMAEGNPFAEPIHRPEEDSGVPTPLPTTRSDDSWGAYDSAQPEPPAVSPEPTTDVRAEPPTMEEPLGGPETFDEPGALPSAEPAVSAAAPASTEPWADVFAPPADELDDDWFDDEEDEEDFVEPFSLVDHLAEGGAPAETQVKRERFVAAEVVRHRDGRVWDVALVKPGQSYRPGPGQPEMLRMKRGECVVTVPAETDGTVWIGGAESALSARPPGPDGQRTLTLKEGDRVLLKTDEGQDHLVQVLKPPKATKPAFIWVLLSFLAVAGFAVGVGGALMATLAVLGPVLAREAEPVSTLEEHFEEISQNDLALIAAQVEDVVEVEEEEEEVEEEDAEDIQAQELEPEVRPRTSRRRSRAATGGGGSAASRLLAKLRGGGGGRGSGTSLQDVITNIDAVGSPSAASGLFRTTGLFSSLPGGQVKIARVGGGGGGVATVGGKQLAGKGLGQVEGSGGRRGKVRGRVSRVSSQARVRGNLDRGEVLRVINRASGAIQRCYERRLIANPTLSGRLVFGWTINTSGRVAGVSVRSSTLSDPAVASCITGVIRRLRFPQPEGGSVSISFPFLFRAVEF